MVIMQYYGEIIPDIYPEDFAKIPENEKYTLLTRGLEQSFGVAGTVLVKYLGLSSILLLKQPQSTIYTVTISFDKEEMEKVVAEYPAFKNHLYHVTTDDLAIDENGKLYVSDTQDHEWWDYTIRMDESDLNISK